MPKTVLITGGAGFIGSHVADALLAAGHRVRLLDNLSPQVHRDGARPAHLEGAAELVVGDVRDPAAVVRALAGIDAVIHLAAAVGVGQSMYEIAGYTAVNDLGTAVLMEALARRPVERLVCASSMSIYGEGLAQRSDGMPVEPPGRSAAQLRHGQWELRDGDGAPLAPLPTPETKRPALSSVYALNKFAQEQLCLIAGGAYAIPTVALRFFNVYGPRQALSNPYTGVLAIFAARLLNGRPPLIFEDGLQRRDFVHVRDVARACRLALETERSAGEAYNIGSGEPRTVLSVAEALAALLDRPNLRPHVTGRYRAGDIRHCFADIAKARDGLGFAPTVGFREGLEELVAWLPSQVAVDSVERATAELAERGLVA
ncbi:MAG: NAD-dependent epimerase/dehydratase family protein [Rhodospirillaceae bacterium]|nr:NAD-dependent epimerase/dehydratase family protein [Rhodospirillaceae bacterium]